MRIKVNDEISLDIKLKNKDEMTVEELETVWQLVKPISKANKEIETIDEVSNSHDEERPTGKNRHWTEEDIEQFRQDCQEMTALQLARKHGLSEQTIYNYRKKFGIKRPETKMHNHKWTRENCKKFMKDIERMNAQEVADKWGMTKGSIYRTKCEIKSGRLKIQGE